MSFARPAIPPHAECEITRARLAIRASWHSLKAQAWKESVVAYFAGTRGLREDVGVPEAIAAADKIVAAYEHRFAIGFEQLEEDEAEATRTMYEQSPMPYSLKAQAWKESVVAYFAGTRGLREDATVAEAIAAADKILAAYEHRFAIGFEQIEEDEAEATRKMYEASPPTFNPCGGAIGLPEPVAEDVPVQHTWQPR